MEDREIKRTLIKCFPLVILAIVIPILAIFSVLKPEGEELTVWFQRSGSIVVLLAVWIEYNLFQIHGEIYPTGFIPEDGDKFTLKYGKPYDALKLVGAVLAVWGTIIWGYGDILYGKFL